MKDIDKIQKIFCENIVMGFSQEYFVMGVNPATENMTSYALSPAHTKRLNQYLDNQIKAYEEKFGKIDAKWEPGIQSSIQTQDLKKK